MTRVFTEFSKWISKLFYMLVDIKIFGISLWQIISLLSVFIILEIIIKSLNKRGDH